MAIMIPGWLQWLEWVAGTDWPEGNEDLQQQLGQDVEAVADQIRDTVVPAVERAVDAVLVGYPDGDGTEQIKQELDKLVPQLEQLADSYDKMGQSAAEHATQIRSNKLNGIIALAWLAAELAYAAFLGPAAPAAQAGALAATQIAFRWLGTRLLNAIGSIVGKMAISHTAKAIVTKVVYEIVQEAIVEVLQGTSQELAVQGLNMADGFQDHMKWGEVGQNAAISAIAGGVGGGAGHGMHNLMGRTSLGNDRWGGMAKGAMVGAGAGLAGAGGAYVSTGAITGQWELDPRMLTGGALSGMGPSMVHGWRGSSDYGGGPMSNTRPTAAVGSTPGTNSAGAGDGSSAVGVANGSGAVAANGNGPGNTATAARGSQGAGAAADAAGASANTAVASSNDAATAGDSAATSVDTSGQGAGDGSVNVAGDGSTNGAGDGSVNVAGDGSTNGAGEGATSTDETQFSATDGASTPNSESAAGTSAETTTASDPGGGRAEQPAVVADASTVPAAESGNQAGVPHSDNSTAEGQVHGAAGTQPPVTSPAAVGPAASTTATGPHPSSAGTSNASPQSGAAASSPAQPGGSAAAQSSTSSPRDRSQVQERQEDMAPSRQADMGTADDGGVRASADTARAGVMDGSVPRVPADVLEAGPTDSVPQQHVSDSTATEEGSVGWQPEQQADQNAAAGEVLPASADLPTTTEIGHAKDALRQLGDDAAATDLLHGGHRGPDVAKSARAQARANARWWDSLTEAQQRAVVRVYPEEIGNAPGLDPAAVDTANRLRIAWELDALSSRSDLDTLEQKQLDNLHATVRSLAEAQRRAAAVDPDMPVRVLAYDATRFGGQGRAAVAFGDLIPANHISWHVPGRGHSLSNFDAALAKALGQFDAAAQRTRPGETVASVAWLGYDVPSNARQGFTTSRAREGAGQLVQDIASIDAVRAADAAARPTNKVIAHGYGVDVAEASGRRDGLSGLASDVALVTPHDESVLRPDRFGDDVRVFHGASSDGLYSRIDAEYTGQQGNAADKRLFGLNLISADGVGAVAHRLPDTEPAAAPDEDVSSAGDRRNNCAPLSLQAAARYSGNTDIAVLDPDSIGPEGMHWRALQDAAGGELTRVSVRSHRSPHDTIAEALRRSGGRSTALVVDEQHGAADEYGVGAHAYVMYVDADTGAVMVDDPRIGPPFEFDQENPPDVQATWGVFYGADGSPMRPLGLASGSADSGETSPDDPGATSGRPEPHGSGSAVRGSDSASGRRDPGTMSTDRDSDAAGSLDSAAGSHDSAAGTGRDEAPTRPSRIGDSGETSEQLIGPRIARNGLLADVSITADDHRLVESARRALVDMSGGQPDFDSLIPDSDAADASIEAAENRAKTNARWWHELSVPEQRALAVVHPDIIGRADGIPAAVRDEANRLSLGREISGYRDLLAPRHGEPSSTLRRLLSRASLDEQQRSHMRALAHIQQSLVDAEKSAASVHPDVSRPEVRLLSYDGAQPRGRAVVAFGDVDTAASVSWHVFGVRSDADSLPETLALVRNAYETTVRADQDVTAAAIAWLDYEVPGTDQQATGPVAEVGGARLASAVAGFHATREYLAEHRAGIPTQDHHLFGLRFGATVVSEAAAGARLDGKVTSLVLLGASASGTGSVRSAVEFGSNVRVYAASSSRGRIGTAGIRGAFGSLRDAGPGTDPTIESFGATRIAAEIPVEGGTATKKSALTRMTLNAAGYEQPTFAADNPVHSQYYWFTDQHTRQPTEGLANMGRIASGHGGAVVLAPHRTASPPSKLWQRSLGSRVVDPESQRRVTFYDGTVDRDVVALPESADTASLVRDALGLRGPGVRAADVMHSGHADDMTRARDLATDNARWWDALSEGAAAPGELSPMQRALVDAHPFEVGNAEGIPARVRDIANRLQLDRELRELRTRRLGSTLFLPRGASSITPLERQQMRNLLATREALGRSGTVRPGIERPPVHLLSFDSLAFGGAGRAVVALGDIDTAEHVAWQVPGITTTVEKLPKRLQMARDPYEAMAQANPEAKIASIAWIGYNAPSGKTIMLETPSPAFAEVGGRLLARDVMGYHAARVARATEADGAPHIHLFGHSYGSTTTGYGAAGGRLSREVATITLVGSPGAGPVQHASGFGIGAENVFVAKVSYDPVTGLGGLEFGRAGRFFNQGLGLNPSIEEFGAIRVPSQFPPIGPFGKPFPAHGAYFDYINRDTGESPESLQNFGLIATGRGAEVRRVLHRVVPENPRVWHRTFGWAPRDPEGQRSPGDGTRPYQPEGTPVVREPMGDQPATPRGDRPEIQGHRGGRGLWSENTLAGYAQTLDLGVDVIELDVGLTSDGIPVVSHEQRIDAATARDTGPTRFGDPQYPYVGKPIRELSLEQVRTLSTAMVQQKFAATQHAAPPGSRVPSLAEVAELADGRGVTLAVEVKTDPSWSDADVRALVAATVDTLSGYGVQYRILGFDWRVLDLAAQLAPPGVERVGLISARTATRAWLGHGPGATQLGRLRGVGAELVGPPRSPVSDISALARQAGATMLSPSRAMVTEALVQHAGDNDMPLVPYTVNDPNEMRALIDQGVDGIVTDFPDLLRAVLTEQSFEVPESTQPQPVSSADPALTHSSDTVSANDVASAAAGNSGSGTNDGSGRGVDIGPAPGQPWDAAEQAVRDKGPASQYQKIAGSSYESAVFLVEFADHSRWVYKPISQMVTGQITVLPSGPIPREVAAYRRDLLLGFGLVPPTVAWTGRYGEGTLQELVRGQPGVPVARYSRLHQDMQLVLDYLGAERDGHRGNLMPAAGDARRTPGDLVSIDNEHKNPLDDDRVGIRSSFVVDGMNQPLHPQVLEAVQRLEPDVHEAMLTELGIEPEAIAGELRRAQEIREEGLVTSREWSGKIRDVPRVPEQEPEPQEPTAEPDPVDRKPTLWQRMRNMFTPAPIPEPTGPTTDDGSGGQLSDAADRVIPVNDCAPRSLRTLVDLTGSDVVQVPDSGSVGLSGMSDARLEEAAGGRLENFGSRDRVAERLTALGPGAAVVVVEQYSGPADRHGVGAHAYVMTNADGVVIVRDPGLGSPHTYQWSGTPPEVSGVSGIVFAADGAPARPVTGHEANPDAYSRTGIGVSEPPRNPAERGEPVTLIFGEEGSGPKGEQQRLEAGSHTWRWLTEQLSGWPGDRLDDIGLEVADLVAVKLAGADSVRVELDEAGEPGVRNVRITVADTVMEFVAFPPIPAWVVEAIAPVRHLALSTPEGPAVAVGFRRFQQISRALASFSDAGGTLEVAQDRIDHGLRHRSNVNRSRLHAMQHNVEAEYVSLRSEGDRAELTIYPFRDQDLRDGMRRLGLTGRGDAPIALDVLADAIRDTLSERRTAWVAKTTVDGPDEPPPAREVADERGESGSVNGDDRCTDGEPVDMATGDVIISADDAQVPGIAPMNLRRTHVSSLRLGRHFGSGWLSILDERLELDDDGIVLVCADGAVLSYPLPETNGGEVFPESGRRWPLSMRGDRYLIRDLVNGTVSEYAVPVVAGSYAVPTVRLYRGGRALVFDTDDQGTVLALRSPGGPTLRMDIDPDTRRVAAIHLESESEHVLLGRYRYTDTGDLAEVTDRSRVSMRYAYDAAHRLVSWTDSNDVSYHHRYNEAGRCVAQVGTGGVYANAYVYGRDEATGGRWTTLIETVRELDTSQPVDIDAALAGLESMPIVRKIRAEGPVVSTGTDPDFGTLRVLTFRTDTRGNVWQISAADGAVSTFERDSAHQLVRSVDPSGATVSYERDRYGAVTAIVGPDGATTTVQRGSWGEPIAETGPGGRVWAYETDTVGNTTMVTAPDGAATRYQYQQQQLHGPALRRVTAPNGLSTDVECDSAGLPIRVTAPGNRTWTYARDEFGRIGTSTDPLGRATVRTWTPGGRPLQQRNPDGTVLRWSYDDEGNQLSHTNEAGQHSRTVYTVMDLPCEVGAPDGGVLRIGYDTQLQVTSVTNQKGLLWRYEYDSAGRLTAETDYNGARTSYAYDLAGRLHAKTNAVGQTTCYGYDAAGRIAEHTDGDEVTVYRYDQHGDLVEATNSDAVVRFSRDALGRVHTERINDAVVASSYDEAGNRTTQIVDTRAVPDAGLGWRTMFGYDDTGMLISAGADDGARASETLHFGYDSAGHETARQVGAAQISRRYDQRDRIIAQHVHNSSGVIAGKAWSYRPDGYVTATDDVLRGPRHFELDTAGRVDAVAMPSSVTGSPSGHAETEPGTTDTEQYRYDAAGVLRFASTASTSTSAAVGEMSDESVASVGTLVTQVGRRRFWYDAAGRLVRTVRTRISHKPEVFEFTHTAQGQIRSVFAPDGTRWRYGYDPFGRRVTKVHTDNSGAVLESTVYAWDGDHLVFQHNRTGTGTSSWCWTYHPDTGEPLAQHSRTTGTAQADILGDNAPQSVIDTEFHAIVTDLSGAPTELIDPRTGTVAGWSSNTLWGRTQWHGHAATDLRFAGQLFDAETGLHYNRYRYYNPVTATYTAPDPLGLEPNPASATAYVHNPHTWVDPLGLAGCGTSWWQRIRRFGPLGAARQEYVDSVRAITIEGIARIEAGESSESVAHWAIEHRNAMKVRTRAKLPGFLNAWAERRNNRHYGHPVGPTFELLHEVRGKTSEEIIVGAGRTNARVDRLLGVHTDD